MNRRGFMGLLTMVVTLPLAVIFPKRKMGIDWARGKDRTIITEINPVVRLNLLKARWLDGAPLGIGCRCKNKITVERGTYETYIAGEAYVTYCQKHGFDTDCWMCNTGNPWSFSTESCDRDHYSIHIKEAIFA